MWGAPQLSVSPPKNHPLAHHSAGVAEILRRQPQALGVQFVEPRFLPPLQPLAAVGTGVGAGTQHLTGT